MKHVLSEYILNILVRKIRKNIHSDGIMSQQKYNLDFLDLFILFCCKIFLPSCTYVHHVSAWCSQSSEEGMDLLAGVIDVCEPLCRCLNQNLILCKSNKCS